MKNYIFDREKDDFLKDDDGERVCLKNQIEVYDFLKDIGYKDDFIKENFTMMKACKVLICEEIDLGLEKEIPNPAPGKYKPFIVANFREILDAMTREEISFSKGVELLNELAAKYYEPKIIDFGVFLENLEPLNKVTVHAPDGSGTGLYYKTIEQLYKDHKAQS